MKEEKIITTTEIKSEVERIAKEENSIIAHAYRDLIKSYENTILFLKAQRYSSIVRLKNKIK